MGKKLMGWKTKGMNRDLSVSAFNPEFAFENMNLRLNTNDGNTLLSWVNEKGPKVITFVTGDYNEDEQASVTELLGTPIGTAILNHQLVVFTTTAASDNTAQVDRIYKLKYKDADEPTMLGVLLYSGNLGFDTEHPLETMVYYEAEYIQKVYWVDGINQPRLININASSEQRAHWNENSTYFDFAPAVNLNETFIVTKKQAAGGLFAPGVIQYCFTYVNKYGQQTNIINVSPLEYLSHSDRGASPEEKVTCNCEISITGFDTTFDFVRLYSIQRTSLDLEPIVKILEDIDIEGKTEIKYTDNGTTGAIIDPTELLYVGGKEIIANTLEDKDNTLFLGNLTHKHGSVNDIQDSYRNTEIRFDRETKGYDTVAPSGTYAHDNSLKKSSKEISAFKGGEIYRFGFQLQKATGEWSEPIYLNDATNTVYPSITNNRVTLAVPTASLSFETDITSVYKRIRPLVVYPNIGDRQVLCQGVLNPTVFNALDRIDNSPYAQASWFFRPNCSYDENKEGTDNYAKKRNMISRLNSSDVASSEKELDTYLRDTGDPYFKDKVIPVYVMIIITEDYKAKNIMNRKYLTARRMADGKHTWEKVNFWGGIWLPAYSSGDIEDNRAALALVKKEPWERTKERNHDYDGNPRPGDENYFHYDDGYSYEVRESRTFYMYKDMQVTSEGRLYYIKPAGKNTQELSYFHFKFTDSNKNWVYQVAFCSLIDDTTGISESPTLEHPGNMLRFKHYDSLYSINDAIPTVDDHGQPVKEGLNIARAKQIEIQGSINKFESPFGKEDEDINSNTQFFVDQSIVTINSPDIEFDTEVQTYGTEGLQLRIVGAIPINANVSAHNTSISSSMLEAMHNWGSDQTDIYFGVGEKNKTVMHKVGEGADAFVGNRLISDYLWNDTIVTPDTEQDDGVKTTADTCNYLIYPWQRKGSLNNDFRTADMASSMLSTKKESCLLYSSNTDYLSSGWKKDVKAQMVLTENSEVLNTRLDVQGGINYYANIDKILYNESGYKPITDNNILNSVISIGEDDPDNPTYTSQGQVYDVNEIIKKVFSPIPMRYKSTSHAVVGMVNSDILPNAINIPGTDHLSGNTYWGGSMSFNQSSINYSGNCFLWLGELVKEPSNHFGGTSKEAIEANKWVIGGDAVDISDGNSVTLKWTEGDTYYQRYDCLKTYAYTPEDTNQIVEILSFMCETHVNIDGRYDRNRGQVDNTNIRPDIFNKLNTVYSQKNNFFISQKTGLDDRDKLHYPNYITYTKTKTSGADVDFYTNVTLASTMELDGDKGEITSLNRFNNQLIAFQDTGVSQLLYNENMMMSTDKGVPVEIANSGKVTGKTYLSNTIGCSNKWSICQTPSGIYFIDSNEKSIYLFNGQFQNLSVAKGFNSWSKMNFPSNGKPWDPVNFGAFGTKAKIDYFTPEYAIEFHPVNEEPIDPNNSMSNFVTYYDKQNQDVLFISRDTCLAYSERLGVFTSFYSYEDTPFFNNLDTTGVWLTKEAGLYKHQAGSYGDFFGTSKPYWMTLIGNPEPQTDKTFTNLEFRACVTGEGTMDNNKFMAFQPFDTLEVWDEYQHGIADLSNRSGHDIFKHHLRDNTAALLRKFRIWRCDIPRDNAPVDDESESLLGIKRFKTNPVDRMRNPWLYLKLKKNAESELPKTEIHDLLMTYFN